MNCCLWLNGVKIRHADEIKNNFDAASLRGYFSGGSLIRWLNANGGGEAAGRLAQTSGSDDLTRRLEYAFGLDEEPPESSKISELPETDGFDYPMFIPLEINHETLNQSSFGAGLFKGIGSFGFSGLGSYELGSYELGSYELGSYELGSYELVSYELGSGLEFYGLGSYGWGSYRFGYYGLWGLGSYSFGSFGIYGGIGSYNFGHYGFGSYNFGSYNFGLYGFGLGSYNFGSYGLGSYDLGFYGFGSYDFGSYDFGSYDFGSYDSGSYISADRIVSNPNDYVFGSCYDALRAWLESFLNNCPLNRYGYGIHII
ncbi:MAG: hypothetical protein FWH08_03535 [Oscillospiraceae bacterium]|nr:hypothetical protein [Oscillospiraceae bacterium]